MARPRAKKTAEPVPPVFSFPCTTSWYDAEEDREKIPENVWCLLWTVDEMGEESLYVGRFSSKLKIWLTNNNTAMEVYETVKLYSPVFQPNGEVWKLE